MVSFVSGAGRSQFDAASSQAKCYHRDAGVGVVGNRSLDELLFGGIDEKGAGITPASFYFVRDALRGKIADRGGVNHRVEIGAAEQPRKQRVELGIAGERFLADMPAGRPGIPCPCQGDFRSSTASSHDRW